jgi:hypothetical protein
MIADEKVGQKGVKVKCKKCGNIIVVKPRTDGTGEAPSIGETPAPAAAAFPQASFSAPAPAPAAAPADSQMGGAFDSLFGGGAAATAPTVGGSAGLGSLAAAVAPSAAAAPAAKKAGEKEWYVAIDDSQVGPIDVGEIEQRWDAREIEEDSLAWKAGMSDWVAVAEIPELAFLVTQKPHQKAPAARGGAKSGAGQSAAAGAAAFGAAAAASEEISWKPSAASALSSLVQEEIQAAAFPKAEPAKEIRPSGVPDLGFGAGDLFGAGGGGNGAARASDPFAAPAPAWSVPTTPRRSGGFRAIYLVFGVMGLAIVGLLGFVAWRLTGAQPAAQQQQQPQPSAPQASAAAPATPTPAPQPDAQPSRPTRPSGGGEDKKPAAKTTTPRDEPPPPAKTKPKGGGDDIDDLLDDDKPKKGGGAPAKESLTKDDIINGVKKNGPMVGECLKAARGKNEIVPGEYKFILDWTIRQDGGVSNPKLKGPANVMGTSLPACFGSVMRRWTFPASQKETPIANFPFGPINIR